MYRQHSHWCGLAVSPKVGRIGSQGGMRCVGRMYNVIDIHHYLALGNRAYVIRAGYSLVGCRTDYKVVKEQMFLRAVCL